MHSQPETLDIAVDILVRRFQAHFAPDTIGLGTSVRKVVLLGGKAFVEDGPLALFIGKVQDFIIYGMPLTIL